MRNDCGTVPSIPCTFDEKFIERDQPACLRRINSLFNGLGTVRFIEAVHVKSECIPLDSSSMLVRLCGSHSVFVFPDPQRGKIGHQPARFFHSLDLLPSPSDDKGHALIAFGLGWYGGNSIWLRDVRPAPPTREITIETVVERIIDIESDGDPNKKSKRSSATGPGQFLDQTWLELIRIHRPDLARGRSEDETLELRRDAKVAREITTRFAEHNAEMLRKKGLPVTPGTLYLAHFAGSAGAVAILSAPEHADAASAMARADATGRTRREKIIKANPFLERFTVADLRSWADRKMRVSGS